jgi:hypothetical protein
MGLGGNNVNGPSAESIALMQATQQRALQDRVNKYIRDGYRVVSQSPTTAQLVRPKKFSLFFFLLWLIVGLGFGALVYIGWYMAKRDEQIYLVVDANARVSER